MYVNRSKVDTNIDVSLYKFYNEPVMRTLEDYDTARDEFVHHISKDPGVLSIYQIGNVGVHGISDLDFVVVLNKGIGCKENYFSIKNFNKKTKYILFHDQFFVNEPAIKNIYKVAPISNLTHVYGEKFEINKLEGEELKYNTLILLNDICVVSLCYEYLDYIKSKNLDVRLLLARLNSLKYPIQMISSLLHKSLPEFDSFVSNFKEFRVNWFDFDEMERRMKLIYYLHGANDISQKLVRLIQEYNYRENIFEYSHSNNYNEYFDGEDESIKFYNSSTSNLYQGIPALDIIFGFHLKEYTKLNGAISNHINSHLSRLPSYKLTNEKYQKLQREHISLLNNLTEFRESINLSFGGLFTFGYRKSNLSSKIRENISNLLRLLRRNNL